MVKFSEEIKELFNAILEFQKKVGKILKTEENPFFKAKYADLSGVLDESVPKLIECGLVFSCTPCGNNELTTLVVHAPSGQYMSSTFSLNIEPSYDKEKENQKIAWRSQPYFDSQKWGAAVTYARRFAITSILNLNVDKDSDGNKLGNKAEEEKKPFLNRTKLGSSEVLPEYVEAVEEAKKTGSLESLKAKYRITKEVQQQIAKEADI